MKSFHIRLFICMVLILTNTINEKSAFAQSPVCAYCNRTVSQINTSGHASNCPYYVAPKKSSYSGIKPVASNSLSVMVAGTLMQGILSGIFSSDQQQQKQKQIAAEQQQLKLAIEKEKQKKIKDSIDRALHLKLMASYKSLQGAQQLDFKKMDGDMEGLSSNARNQFDGLTTITDTNKVLNGTNFFGTQLAQGEIQTLIDPDKDSVILDINNADKYIRENKITDSAKVASLKNDTSKINKENKSAIKSTDCEALQKRLDNYFDQRNKFHKTIISTQADLNEWKQKNNDAMWNAAISGFEFAFGKFLNTIELRGSQAENIKNRLLPYEDALRKKGVNVDDYMKTLNARIFNANYLAKDVSEFKDAAEYDAFFRDAVQIGMAKIAESDTLYDKILKDSTVKQVLNDGGYPQVDAEQFLAGKALEKFLKGGFLRNLSKFNNKIPYVTYAQFAVDQAYNALDWYLSYKRITQLHEVSGNELKAAMSLQMNIDKTVDELKRCN